MTVEAWVYPTAFAINSDNGSIVCNHGWSGTGQQGFVLRCGGNGVVAFNISGGSASATTGNWKEAKSAAGAISLSTWSHVAGTYDGDSVRVFVNGVQMAALGFTGIVVGSPNQYPLSFGRLADPSQSAKRYFTGNIDEIRIWNRALTSAELTANMSKQLDTAGQVGLVGYWRLNDSIGSTNAMDMTASNNAGALGGGANFDGNVPFGVQLPPQPTILRNGFLLRSSYANGNQWYKDGSMMPGATSRTISATQNGSYQVEYTDTNGCKSISDTVNVLNVGIIDPLSKGFRAYPNPGNGQFFIEHPTANVPTPIKVLDLSGRLVYESIISAGTAKTIVQLQGLEKGLYVIQIGNDERQTARVVVE
jgi:hypothetical protein